MFARIVALAVIVMVSPVVADDVLPADQGAGRKLLAEGDKLADKGEPTEAVLRYKKAFEQLLPSMRKLHFKHEVKRDVTARKDLRAVILEDLDDETTPGEFRGDELGMKALGLLPRSLDLKETMVRLYTEQIAAFYDPKTKTMHLIKEEEAAKPKPSFLERLLGKTGGFDKDENKTVLAHELTHALADQNFDLDAMQSKVRRDDDRQLALAALIEGEATLTMMEAQAQDWDGNKFPKMPAADVDAALRLMGPMLAVGGGPSLREAPPILSESMIFPYFRGMVFCLSLTNRGGWDWVDEAYKNPPLSTEQVLHPEKYRGQPDPPTIVDLGPLDAGPGWSERGRNVVGEMQMEVLLHSFRGKAAAAGWDGDRFAVFEGPDGKLGLVWSTTWDTEADAREFVHSYARFQTTKLGKDVPEPAVFPDSIRRPSAGAVYAIERHGLDVAIVEGFSSPATESLLSAALHAKKTEKTQEPTPEAVEALKKKKAGKN
ncbi:MAG TPA: hypothetical protein VG406_15405 [Isosphaeraceae bacterium]|jgi:hypothetical protein|nr:hypothetical protein [Isosphaeraceae bacterium]